MGITILPLAIAALASTTWTQTTTNSTSGPIVDLGYAQYRGNTSLRANFSTDVYYGIRFAQAPIGELRWQPPQNIEAHNDYNRDEVIDAQTPSPSCVQGMPAWQIASMNETGPVPVPGQEDCLLLDVYVPEQPKSASLPVLVNIHGGGYTEGNAAGNAWQALVDASGGEFIFVSTQYRLGAYGFLSSAEVRENGQANAGLLDQRSALQWVQRNIRAFGGDPAQVTIIGGSAGGGSVMDQMIMYGGVASPPFRGVISEYPWWQPFKNNTILENQYRELLSSSGCKDIQCLRNLNETALKTATQQTYITAYKTQPSIYGYGDFYYGPSVDGDVIRDLPSNEWKQGHFTKVPLLVDRNGYEGYVFSNQSELTVQGTTADLQELFPYAKQSFFDRLYQLYPVGEFNSTFWQRQTLFSDFIITCPTYYMASAMSDAGVPTYKLIFNAGSQLHGATGPFITEPNDSPAVNNATIAAYMKDWIISFVVAQDPNANSYSNITDKPAWPLYNPRLGRNGSDGAPEFAVMDVNYTQIGAIGDLDVSARCDFFHGSSYDVRN